MKRDEAIRLLRRHHEALNRHHVRDLMTMYADNAVVISPMFRTVSGRAAIGRSFEQLFTLFPDFQIGRDDALFVHEHNRIAEFSTVTATHSAELFGLPPTGHRLEYQAVRLFTFREQQIVHEHRMYDFVGLLERLEKVRAERELTLAANIQRTLLPRTRQEGAYFEAVGTSLPCRTIGGDFFEYVELPNRDFGIAIGDVSGKGPAAALIAAMLQGMFSMVAEAGGQLSDTLARVNRALVRRAMEPRFATLVYGVLAADGRFSYANAGHTPPFLLTRDGARRLSEGGPMLGVFETAAFPSETLTLRPGETFVAFSDGVTEAFGVDAEQFGENRLLACATAHSAAAPAELLEALVAEVRQFSSKTPQSDDLTIVVLRYR